MSEGRTVLSAAHQNCVSWQCNLRQSMLAILSYPVLESVFTVSVHSGHRYCPTHKWTSVGSELHEGGAEVAIVPLDWARIHSVCIHAGCYHWVYCTYQIIVPHLSLFPPVASHTSSGSQILSFNDTEYILANPTDIKYLWHSRQLEHCLAL